MTIQIFLQSELLQDIEALELPRGVTGKELRQAVLARLPAGTDVANMHFFIEDDDDDHPLDKRNEIPDGLRVHLHRQKGIDVVVRYAGRDVRRTFRPSATVGRVKRWATDEMGITPSDGAELMLQLSGTDTRPDTDVHIGALVHSPAKSIAFDLVPSPRVNG